MLRFCVPKKIVRPHVVEFRRVLFKWSAFYFSEFAFQRHSSQGLCSPDISYNKTIVVLMGKRKNHSSVAHTPSGFILPASIPRLDDEPPAKRRASQRKASQRNAIPIPIDPDQNTDILDGAEAWRASPDADEQDERINVRNAGMNALKQIKQDDVGPLLLANDSGLDSPLSDFSDMESPIKAGKKKSRKDTALAAEVASSQAKSGKKTLSQTAGSEKEVTKAPQFLDPEADGEEEPDEEELQAALSRPPPVNSDYLPLPWKGRLGYVCCYVFFYLNHQLID